MHLRLEGLGIVEGAYEYINLPRKPLVFVRASVAQLPRKDLLMPGDET